MVSPSDQTVTKTQKSQASVLSLPRNFCLEAQGGCWCPSHCIFIPVSLSFLGQHGNGVQPAVLTGPPGGFLYEVLAWDLMGRGLQCDLSSAPGCHLWGWERLGAALIRPHLVSDLALRFQWETGWSEPVPQEE